MAELDLTPAQLAIVREILAKHIPDREVRAFGSRVKGNAKKFSDLDLVIMGDAPLPLSTLATLEEAFSESPLPLKVDIVDWAAVDENFRREIWKEGLIVKM